jgi:hypothetical protein
VAAKKPKKLKPIETCPDGHMYNSSKYGDTCPVCGKKLDPPEEEPTPEEIEELAYQDKRERACGWLVCVKGPNKGRDYKIKGGKNFIGTSSAMDIQILGDKRIEKRNHAVFLYDAKARASMLLPGDSRGMAYLEEQAVFEPKTVEAFNKIELGESLFVYAPLCGGEFDWAEYED